MTAYSWEASYSLNIMDMDRQHQGILAIMERINAVLADKGAGILLEELLVRLEILSKGHFFDEERLMEKKDFPSITEHKRQHDLFVEKIRRLKSEAGEERKPENIQALGGWFINHILTEDMHYSEFFLNKH